ncbi:MAG: FAD-dependent oxidoreductase [Aquificaceae bacterium]
MKVVVVGMGMAGTALIEELIKLDGRVDLSVFGEEKTLGYNRINLADVLSGKKLFSQIVLNRWSYYEEKGVKIYMGKRVERIFPEKKLLLTSDGELHSYDKLVIATGSMPKIPPIRGIDKKGIFTFRSIKDVYHIMELARVSKRAVVIGGGLLGVECAKALRDIGLEVYLVHLLDVLMEQYIDKTASLMLKEVLEGFGIKVLLSRKTEEILGNQKATGVKFSNGEEIETDMVVVATGVIPKVELAKNSKIKVDKGVLVNDFLETTEQDIYAVGDCIQHRDRIYGLLSPIMEQVKVCAKNILYGNIEKYRGSLSYAILKVAGVRLMSVGEIQEKEGDEVILFKDNTKYRKAIVRDGRLVGAILFGDLAGSNNILELARSGKSVENIKPHFLIKDLIKEEVDTSLKPEDIVCNCNAVSYGRILEAIKEGAETLEDLQRLTRASTSCGGCATLLEAILKEYVKTRPTKINKVEEYKRAKHPFDVNLIKSLEEWAEHSDWQKIPEEDKEYGLKWYGIFYRKATPGYFMVRIRITHGKLNADQAKVIAHLSKKFGRDHIDLTTREQIQLRWIELKDLPEVISAIESVGLTTLQTGMDNVRNITGDPLSGLTEDSIIDTIPISRRITEVFLGKRQYADLPRKFNIGLVGSERDSINCKYNDLCFYLARKGSLYGFNVYAGGKIGSGGPVEAIDLDIFVLPYESVDITKAVLEIYSDMGNREDRTRNRLYFLTEELGIEGFRSETEKRLSRNLWRKGEDLVKDKGERKEAIIKQKNGLYAVRLVVPSGIFTGENLERLAYLSKRYGSGEIRLSVYQNLYLINIPEEHLERVLSDPLLSKYPTSISPYFDGLIACQGSKTCAFGVIENKNDALRLAHYLSQKVPIDIPINTHWSGCSKGCGQHGAGDIGFVGTKMKVNGDVKYAVDVFIGEKKIHTLPLDNLEGHIEEIIHSLMKEKKKTL